MRNNKIFSLIGFVWGILTAVFAVMTLSGAGVKLSSGIYGADFYTDIDRHVVSMANSIGNISNALGFLLLAAGVFLICFFGSKFFVKEDKPAVKENNNTEENFKGEE